MSRTTRALTTAVAAALALSAGVVPAAQAADESLTAQLFFRDGTVVDVFRPYERLFMADTGQGEELLTFYRGRWTAAGGAWERSFSFGRPGDVAVVGDWDGDGVDEPGVVRGNRYHLASEAVDGGGGVRSFTFGSPSMYHGAVGDWDGDGVDEPMAVTGAGRSIRFWFATEQADGGGTPYARDWGRNLGDGFAVGDVDGDGTDSITLQRPNLSGGAPTFYISTTSPRDGLRADVILSYGRNIDAPVLADVSGDERDEVGVLREYLW
ncbi:hypothetical protein [uncultured Pseudokineococcus sp.]|uniref:hypothetical protein n=1 Tax=uncultured Pseudokineococcus sp. TaxID=1642928 RepID=UPI002618A067|nr:hypothetical protein [uncultured Pseudokineococcus sp.]